MASISCDMSQTFFFFLNSLGRYFLEVFVIVFDFFIFDFCEVFF